MKFITKMKKSLAKKLRKLIYKLPESRFKDDLLKKYCNVMSSIVLIVGQNCTLKCKNCANFSPYLANKLPFYNAEEIIADLHAITNEAKLEHLQVQGGEFFLHPQSEQILDSIISNDRILNVTIATNATIIPKDSILQKIKDSKKIMIRMSNYGLVNEKTAKRLESKLKELEIPNMIYNFALNTSFWAKCGEPNMKKLSTKEMLYYFNQCFFGKYCLTMENGFITRCSRATIAHLVQGFNLNKNDGLFLNIGMKREFSTYGNLDSINATHGGGVNSMLESKIPFSFKNLESFLKNYKPITACYYCYGTAGEQIIAGEQFSKKELQQIKESAK